MKNLQEFIRYYPYLDLNSAIGHTNPRPSNGYLDDFFNYSEINSLIELEVVEALSAMGGAIDSGML